MVGRLVVCGLMERMGKMNEVPLMVMAEMSPTFTDWLR